MADHDQLHPGLDGGHEGGQLLADEAIEIVAQDWGGVMRVAAGIAVAGEVFSCCRYTGALETGDHCR